MREIDEDQLKQLVEAHREEEQECRWCFAVDLQRVKANVNCPVQLPRCNDFALEVPQMRW